MTADFAARITEILRDHHARVESHPISGYAPKVGCRCQPRTLINDYPMTQTEHREHVVELIALAAEEHYRPRVETAEHSHLPGVDCPACVGDPSLVQTPVWSPGAGE